ncbi:MULTISPECIES: hypothetical protein [unclassified Microcoleus]|uniref:hypothetical protein n=1 Tax=unclassified Microcoleus TaxID=2642155 RepID=UPI001D780D5E|nr:MULTISPECIES: hypothetical protein [unclassified Microcoleus]MCC3466652.1 hypothetical protein [Microcoleus sp. PH2017_06_SFM_O_A]MCC3582729.1 hypothetical protein [Microcoleus sp. PH2017_30_WIL_O_A]MCC3620760.1 hypothetical protein [Microcoleus sp. PH2017_36_ELK_O_B]
MAVGSWQLAVGSWQLAASRKKEEVRFVDFRYFPLSLSHSPTLPLSYSPPFPYTIRLEYSVYDEFGKQD